jgi:hypothetical protein
MADYAVSAVRYDIDRCLIHRLRVHRVRAGTVESPMDVPRAQIVSAIEYGRKFMAIQLDEGGRYSAYSPIRLVRLAGCGYLRSDEAELPADHLPGLSEF